MNNIRHLFVIDPLEDLNLALDTSLRIARALYHLGHQIFICRIEHISLSTSDGVVAQAEKLAFQSDDLSAVQRSPERLLLNSLNAIHMRKDPPTDDRYWQATWLLSAVDAKVRQYNSPEALRSFNEKCGIALFPEATAPLLVSAQPEEIYAFGLAKAEGDIIVKPLNLFGGRGVTRVTFKGKSTAETVAALKELTGGGKELRMVQPFNHDIFKGEIRVFSAGGTAISWCLKRPKDGDFLANTARGATLENHVPSPELKKRVDSITATLLKRGIFFCGFDIIGGKVSEINITSPRLLAVPLDPALFATLAAIIAKDLA